MSAVPAQQPNPQAQKAIKTGSLTMGRQAPEARKSKLTPAISVATRSSDYVAMMMNPVEAQPALPPIALPARAIPIKLYQEVLLSTDANGNCALGISPIVASIYQTTATFTGTTPTYNAPSSHSEYTNFTTNFVNYIPLVYEVTAQYAGAATASSGRFYGIVAPASDANLLNYPREPNGCEALTAGGISCCWYATSPVWNNPVLATATTTPTEWMDTACYVGLVGGPASVSNAVTIGIWLHLCAFPKSGIVGLTPMYATPDPGAHYAADLMMADNEGLGINSTSMSKRAQNRKKVKGVIRDVLKFGAQSVGTVFPALGPGASAAALLADFIR